MPQRILTSLVFLLGGAITLLVSVFPGISFGYRAPSIHIALETAAALIALLVAYLVFGRFRASGRLDDLTLVVALGILTVWNTAFFILLASVAGGQPQRFEAWGPMIGRLAAAVLIAIAAFLPPRRLPARRLTALVAGLLTVSVVAVIALPVALLSDRLPGGLGVTVSPATFSGQAFTAQLSVSWPHLVTMVVYAAAAIGFTRRAAKGDDELMCWLAAGVALHVVASLNYALYPSLYSEWVYTGDVFRLLFYLVLLGGAAREIRRYWREQAKVAVLEERRRIARELHDGLAQELAFIARRSRRLVDGGPASSIGGQVAAAADRALDEARRAIAALTRPLDEPLEQTLAQAVEEVAARSGTRLELDLAPGIRLAPSTREALVRIAREAVSNAGRHACASVVQVQLADDREPRLVVSDDGVGFDPAALQPSADGGFGLTSMRERADAVGADFLLTTSPGRGTRIEVVFA